MWGARNRVYGPETGHPGRRDPRLTPYVIPWLRAVESGEYQIAVLCTFAQSGKTDGMLDLIGARFDQRPTPVLYVGPSKEFNTDQFEPRLTELFRQAPTLGAKVAQGKRNKKTLKWIAGVKLRLAHAGSSTALKSDPAALALVDEYDEMLANIKGQGDPLGLTKARGDTYSDFTIAVASTPTRGHAEIMRDERSGLDFWRRAEAGEVESQIWRLYQQGTMYHWTWQCPHCRDWFVPRLALLRWPANASPAQALARAWIDCPRCGAEIDEAHKAAMNASALPVAPGQWIEDGEVKGEPPASTIFSLWASGLCSPFAPWGQRAADIVSAEADGDAEKMQTVKNAAFGELFAPGGGEVPEWREVAARRMPYQPGSVPVGVVYILAGIDVQKNRLVFVLRGWGHRATSWLIDHGELWGDTARLDVWGRLTELLESTFGGLPVKLAFVDSGFRPGKPDVLPENRIYDFCRRHQRFVFPTKGYDVMQSPLLRRRIEVKASGGAAPYGLELVRLNTDWWKLWVHERVRWPADEPGAWHLHDSVDEDYCRQIVSEARTKGPSGRPSWIKRAGANHYLDCEAMVAAAAYMLGAHRLGANVHAGHSSRLAAPSASPAPASSVPASMPQNRGDRFAEFARRFSAT